MTRKPLLRRGFTLVELMVAIALAITVLGLAVAVSQSSLTDSYKVTGAGDRLSQFLMTARNRAIRDRAPRGIRILTDEAGRPAVIQYTEAPEAWVPTGDTVLAVMTPAPGGTPYPNANTRIFIAGPAATFSLAGFQGSVQVGDMLSVPELAWANRITAIAAPSGPNIPQVPVNGVNVAPQVMLTLATVPDLGAGHTDTGIAPTTATMMTRTFGIFRQARELLGEPTQSLAAGMAVDTVSPNSLNYQSDILFAPTGEVMNSNGAVMSFLLRDFSRSGAPPAGTALTTANQDTTGEMILVAIYPRTGTVATKAVAPLSGSNTDLHKFAKDGINSGL